jgi:hypothetical protein
MMKKIRSEWGGWLDTFASREEKVRGSLRRE